MVSADAVIHSGAHKTVFVEVGNGSFEPRQVETGWRSGDQVQIVKGLEPGERIVTSGNFLLDSETRMKKPVAAAEGNRATDPACGMHLDVTASTEQTLKSGKLYYFCSVACKQKFLAGDPSKTTVTGERSSIQGPRS